jgi:hypothetical protein
VEVHLEAVELGVDQRLGIELRHRKERVLGTAPRPGAALVVEGDGAFEDMEVVAAVGSLHGIPDGGFDKTALEGGLVDDVGELVRREQVGEVHERAVDGGDGDAVMRRDITTVERAVAVEPDAVEGAQPG